MGIVTESAEEPSPISAETNVASEAAFVQTAAPQQADPAEQLLAGIAAPKASIPPWHLYDDIGSRLFEVITAVPDYYPTRTEAALLTEHLPAIASAVDMEGGTIIDLGAGSCEKAPRLFPFVRPRQYAPVDISADFLKAAVERLQHEHPSIEMIGVGTDFSTHLELPEAVGRERRLFFYPGSSIGNFTPDQARGFLQRVREQMFHDSAMLIGIDLVKDIATLERAYDDRLGVTAAFNRNTLYNVNRTAGTDFDPADWRHLSRFDKQLSRIEMLLEARQPTTVSWSGGERHFRAGERIHTESSYKYTLETFAELLGSAGLRTTGSWTDSKDWFAMFLATPGD